MLTKLLKNRSLWEAPILDLWTVPHFLSGTIIYYLLLQLGVDVWVGLLISTGIAAAWEIFEKITRLSDVEHHTNGVSDVVAAQLGYGLGALLFSATGDTGADTALLAGAALIFTLMCILGWLSHHWYGKQ